MNIRKKIVASLLGVSLLATPAVVGGQTAADLQAQIAALLAQINALQAQLSGITGTPAAGACSFTRSLTVGVRGDDVTCLQNYLTGTGHFTFAGGATGYFGPVTQSAVAAWQAANGVAPAVGYFGPISQARYNSLVAVAPTVPTVPTTPTPGITTPGAEGSMVATIESAPTGIQMTLNSADVAVTAVKAKAISSDIKIDRFDLNFNTRPWLYVSSITVTDGTVSRTISVTQSNSTEITVGSSYDVRVDGLNIIVPADTEKVLTIKVNAVSGLPGTETTKTLTLLVKANAIRGTDGANIQQYAPTAALASRTFTVKTGDTASLEFSASASNPKERPVLVNLDTETNDVVLGVINLKATGNAAILRTLTVTDSTASGTIDVLSVYDGSTLLSSTSSVTTASATLTDINLTIAKDTTKELTIKGKIKKASGNYSSVGSTTIHAGVASSNITVGLGTETVAEDASSFAAATITGSEAVPGPAYFYVKSPTLSLASAEITGISGISSSSGYQTASFKIKVNLTANGGDIYVPTFSATNATSGLVGTVSVGASANLVGEVITTTATEVSSGDALAWVVRSGATKEFVYSGTMNNETAGFDGKSLFVKLDEFHWATSAATSPDVNTEWASTLLTDYKTSPVFLSAP